MTVSEIKSKVYLTEEYEDLETYKGRTQQEFIEEGHTQDEWDRIVCTCDLDQWHSFGNEMVEDLGKRNVAGCVADYINDRWYDYQHFIGNDSSWDEFIAFLLEESPLLKSFTKEFIDDVLEHFKEYLGPQEG